jgi:hypothetical protein
VFQRRYGQIPELAKVEVVTAFNPSGNPVFQRLAQTAPLTEGQYITVWKAYFLALVGNWLLQLYESAPTDRMRELEVLLQKVGLRSSDDSAETIFSKLVSVFGRLLRPKSAGVSITLSDAGIPIVSPA